MKNQEFCRKINSFKASKNINWGDNYFAHKGFIKICDLSIENFSRIKKQEFFRNIKSYKAPENSHWLKVIHL